MYSQRNFSFPVLFLFWNRSFTNRYIYSLFSFIYLMVSELYLKKENPLNNWAYAMLSQMYIALPFALLNVLAFHSDETASLSQYNAILPLSIFIFNWVMIQVLTVQACYLANINYLNASHLRSHGKALLAAAFSVS